MTPECKSLHLYNVALSTINIMTFIQRRINVMMFIQRHINIVRTLQRR